ncbi:DUF4262 domain-containing protein [Mycobacterium sp. pUA109]|uniref:DUF4262 domain-containing protein n=1 Tax=Mycobacterium sp. pUA109 TaxID=3238982 RepID=UPI00351B8A2C
MCWKCDHPEATVEEWLDAIRATVDKHGWAVQYVESDRTPFAYTVGLHEHGLPELLVTGLPPQPTVRLLNTVAAYLMDGGRPVAGDWIHLPDGSMLLVVQVEHPDAHMNVAVAFYGDAVRALQLVWADDHGHRPWCPEFRNGGVRQPVLGVEPRLD